MALLAGTIAAVSGLAVGGLGSWWIFGGKKVEEVKITESKSGEINNVVTVESMYPFYIAFIVLAVIFILFKVGEVIFRLKQQKSASSKKGRGRAAEKNQPSVKCFEEIEV